MKIFSREEHLRNVANGIEIRQTIKNSGRSSTDSRRPQMSGKSGIRWPAGAIARTAHARYLRMWT